MTTDDAHIRPRTPVVIRRAVKWGECDPAGIVYTPRFADYVVEVHEVFLELLFDAPLRDNLAPLNLGLPAKAIKIEFKRSLWPNEQFDVTVKVADIRTRTFDLDMTATLADGTEVFSATLGLICIDKTLREARALPALLKEKLGEYRDRCRKRGAGMPVPEPASGRS